MSPGDSTERIYVAGACAGGGAAVFLKALEDGVIFFGCPSCGCAWPTPPEPRVVDTVEPPERFARAGFTYAQLSEIKAAGLESLVSCDDSVEGWDFRGARGFSPIIA